MAAVLAFTTCMAQAQLAPLDPDWKEAQIPPPPPLRTEKLIKLEMPQSTLRFGVDPASIALGADGIVRYVVVATSSSGAVNAFYEGIHCSTGEVRVYARYNPSSGWAMVADERWGQLHEAASRHSLLIARTGACIGNGTNTSAQQIVRDLVGDANRRFMNN